jgi:rhamnosyl/mannosyltransferase
MRVLHFYKTSYPDTIGGIEQVINQIARGASKLGVKTDVLSLARERGPRTIEIDGYLVHRARLDFQYPLLDVSCSWQRWLMLSITTFLGHLWM